MVAIAALAKFSSGPSQSYVFSVFIDPVIAHTGLSRTALSRVYTVGTLAGALVVVAVSRLADRLGVRVMLAAVAFILGSVLSCPFTKSVAGSWRSSTYTARESHRMD